MIQCQHGRRLFLRNSALTLALPGIQLGAAAQSLLQSRVEWQAFKTTPQYDSLLSAIRTMKSNTNTADPNSWNYWTNVHLTQCPHGVPYFFAWHRGYLHYFERQLRLVSKDTMLRLPYWDYYTNSTIPAEFADPTNGNPLYADRLNLNVRQALTMAPFSSTIINFQRGKRNAFEPLFEGAPHNPVHDIIGNVMSTMNSPVDPIFWLHHANVDRLWVAWVAAGGGRSMPARKNAYWTGSHVYANGLSMLRTATYDTRTVLQYRYANETMPVALPLAAASSSRFARIQALPDSQLRSLPAIGAYRISGPKSTGTATYSLGGALGIGLDRRSVSAQLPVNSAHWTALQEIAKGKTASVPGNSTRFRSAYLVLDAVELADAGAKGGYYYQIYLNVPAENAGFNRPMSLLVGTLGAFQIHGALHHGHGATLLRYPIAGFLRSAALRVGMVSVSFVRIDGDSSPDGPVIGIGEARLELSNQDPET